MKKAATLVLALATLAVFTSNAVAQQPVEYNVTVKADAIKGSPNDHFVTFSGPVQLPDVTLAAGTYVFSIVAPSVVQVSNIDRTEHYALFFTAPTLRPEATEDYQMTLEATIDTAPRRVTNWYLPNQTRGLEFLYPAAGEATGR
jgi:hypothetical protein